MELHHERSLIFLRAVDEKFQTFDFTRPNFRWRREFSIVRSAKNLLPGSPGKFQKEIVLFDRRNPRSFEETFRVSGDQWTKISKILISAKHSAKYLLDLLCGGEMKPEQDSDIQNRKTNQSLFYYSLAIYFLELIQRFPHFAREAGKIQILLESGGSGFFQRFLREFMIQIGKHLEELARISMKKNMITEEEKLDLQNKLESKKEESRSEILGEIFALVNSSDSDFLLDKVFFYSQQLEEGAFSLRPIEAQILIKNLLSAFEKLGIIPIPWEDGEGKKNQLENGFFVQNGEINPAKEYSATSPAWSIQGNIVRQGKLVTKESEECP